MDLQDLFLEDDSFRKNPNAPAEKHLQSPITRSLLDRLIGVYNLVIDYNRNDRFRAHATAHIPYNVSVILPKLIKSDIRYSYSSLDKIATPWIETLKMTSEAPSVCEPNKYPEMFSRSLGSKPSLVESLEWASELYEDEISAFKRWTTGSSMESYCDKLLSEKRSVSKHGYLAYESYRYWDLLVEKYRYKKKNKIFGGDPFIIDDTRFYFFDGFLMEVTGTSRPYVDSNNQLVRKKIPRVLYSYEQLQMFQDACLARFNAYMAISTRMHNGTSELEDHLTSLLRWQEKVLSMYGNKGYELVKGPESLTKAYMTKMTNGDILPDSSFDRTTKKMKDKEGKLNESGGSPMTDILSKLIESIDNMDDIVELFGCTKLSGHPFVYADISAESVRSEGCPTGHQDIIAIRDYHNMFKRLVCERYLARHQNWPPFSDPPRDGTELHRLWKLKVKHIPYLSYPMSDWNEVEFGKFMEFDYSPDYLDMIDDKAINPGAAYAAGFWFKQAPGTYRRLLERLVKTEDVDTFSIVNRMRKGLFHLDERLVELTQKEREFKTSARCFAKLTFEVRLFFVLTEANLKRFMGGDSGDDGYMPQQTMTMSNAKLKKRLYDLTTNNTRDNTCMVEVDFSRWNLRWRGSSVNPISRTLEKIFGLPGVFSQAHEFFAKSTICVTDKHMLPAGVKPGLHASKWPESKLVWRNHIGGFEGIQQTLWTICTIAMMYYSLRDEACTFQMAGQGDNQVFHLTFNRTNESLQLSLMNLLRSMERGSERLNQEVKPEECVDSKTVLTYGKEIYVEGVHKLYSLKFSSRAFQRLDYSIPSLSKEISSVVSNSISTASSLYCTHRAIWWKFFQVIQLLKRRLSSPMYSVEHPGIKRLLHGRNSRRALLIPGSLGGFPMMPWTRYFSKGETDDLSFDTASMYYLPDECKIIRSYITLLLEGEFLPHHIDMTNLISDPHSIPIERPNDSSHLIADHISTELPKLVKNVDLKQLIDQKLRHSGDEFKRDLTYMEPLYPQIASDLFKITPAGLYEKTIKRFSMTRTIERIVPGLDITYQILISGRKLLTSVLDRLVASAKISPRTLPRPYSMASQLRRQWTRPVDNSLIGIYTPFEFELTHISNKYDYISVSTRRTQNLLTTTGFSPPDFGSVTRQKVSKHGYRIVNCNSTMRDIKQAILIYSELKSDVNLERMINSVVKARSPWEISQLISILPTHYGGSPAHRHASETHHFFVMGSCSLPTHVTYSSDNAGILSAGEHDYPVVFQTLFLTLVNMYQSLDSIGLDIPPNMAYKIPRDLSKIDDTRTEISVSPTHFRWGDLSRNKLAYVKDIYASEVPTVPDPNIIKHINSFKSLDSLLYSYLESEAIVKYSSSKIWDGILDPKDIFDLKEIRRVDPEIAELAFVWILLSDCFSDLVYSKVSDQDNPAKVLRDTMVRKSLVYSGLWVRVRLHPIFSGTEYNAKNLIALRPGENGYKRAVEYIATRLRRRAKEICEIGDTSIIPSLHLFDDWKSSIIRSARRRIVLYHVLKSYPQVDLDSLRRTIDSTSPPSQLLERDPASYIHSISKPVSRNIHGYSYDMVHYFWNISPKEAMRTLRDLPTGGETRHRSVDFRPFISNHGMVKYKTLSVSGYTEPDDSRPHVDSLVRFETLRRRCIGKTSSLFSDWNCVLYHLFNKIHLSTDTEIHLFGVGRGSTARFVSRDWKSIGYDLLDSFPVLSHRASSYLPPELVLSETNHQFTWSDHTFRTGGNVLEGHLDLFDSDKVLSIVDLDMEYSTTMEFFGRLPLNKPAIIRLKTNHSQFLNAIDIVRPDAIYSLVVVDNQVLDSIMYVRSKIPTCPGNHNNIKIELPINAISYSYRDNELMYQFMEEVPVIAKRLEMTSSDKISVLQGYLRELKGRRKDKVLYSEKELWTSLNYTKFRNEDINWRVAAVACNILDLSY